MKKIQEKKFPRKKISFIDSEYLKKRKLKQKPVIHTHLPVVKDWSSLKDCSRETKSNLTAREYRILAQKEEVECPKKVCTKNEVPLFVKQRRERRNMQDTEFLDLTQIGLLLNRLVTTNRQFQQGD
jgi:hypothetical protein